MAELTYNHPALDALDGRLTVSVEEAAVAMDGVVDAGPD